ERAVDILAAYLDDSNRPITLRLAASSGMMTLGKNRHLYSEEARQRAVTALCHAVEHDHWEPVRAVSSLALMSLGEKRAIGILERVASHELETRAQREMRVAAHALRTGDKSEEQLKLLRKDLDQVREENRKLKEQLGAIEARIK
ncbi:MAG TPA: hypothetical protein VEL69_09130, partial [Ktedonobacteraceae bacterium]|nr:hypothetical protein [Ktedonobacteraceae bacterium]